MKFRTYYKYMTYVAQKRGNPVFSGLNYRNGFGRREFRNFL